MKCYKQSVEGTSLPGFVAYLGNPPRAKSCMDKTVALKCLEMAYEHRAAK